MTRRAWLYAQAAWLVLLASAARGAEPVPGTLTAEVPSATAGQSYALYLPSAYQPERRWPVLFVFDPGARGANGVQHFQAAAEQFGYIVACSNNSRNGQSSRDAIAAVLVDVTDRFSVDTTRMYTAGMSGGARVAMSVALIPGLKIAGVVAASAGYPDATVHERLPFVVYATAGNEDFNHLEMRQIDAALKTPHRLVEFAGGHQWLPEALAVDALAWLEIQAMRSGLRPRDEGLIARLYEQRVAAAGDATDAATLLALRAIAADFDGLHDVAALKPRIAALEKDRVVKAALRSAQQEDERELQTRNEVWALEDALADATAHADALAELRERWRTLGAKAQLPEDSAERRMARRLLANLAGMVRSTDPAYLAVVHQYRPARAGSATANKPEDRPGDR